MLCVALPHSPWFSGIGSGSTILPELRKSKTGKSSRFSGFSHRYTGTARGACRPLLFDQRIVFFYLYADAIAERDTDFLTFANYRIARLYPLHLATLLLVTVLQSAYYLHFGAFFVYQLNDVKHFVMQLPFASNWSWNSPFTFNGPVWSLSIEVLLYGIFFVVAFARMTSSIVLALLAVAGALIVREHPLLGHGLLSFFTGGLCLYIVREWRANHRLDVGALVAFIAVVTLSTVIQRISHDLSLMERLVEVVAFPAIIIALALNEERLLPITSRLKWLGDISYSSYLLHFPLALALVTFAAYANFAVNPSSAPLCLRISSC